jgi:hypothetical protein
MYSTLKRNKILKFVWIEINCFQLSFIKHSSSSEHRKNDRLNLNTIRGSLLEAGQSISGQRGGIRQVHIRQAVY